MNRIKTLITMIKPTPEIKELLSELDPYADISFLPDGENIGNRLPDVEVLYGSIPENDFQRANKIRWIQTNSTGVDQIMYPAFKNRGLPQIYPPQEESAGQSASIYHGVDTEATAVSFS